MEGRREVLVVYILADAERRDFSVREWRRECVDEHSCSRFAKE